VFGIDPILAARHLHAGVLPARHGGLQVYYVAFERRDDQSLRGLSFFFGICSSPRCA
jgi:branched-chain amino acid transport system permease protein